MKGHGFNVKEATIGITPWDGATVVVAGQISHRLAFRIDDQVYYTINYKNGMPDKQNIRIDRGGVAAIVDIVISTITYGG